MYFSEVQWAIERGCDKDVISKITEMISRVNLYTTYGVCIVAAILSVLIGFVVYRVTK